MRRHGLCGVHRLAGGLRCRLETMSLCTAGVAVAVQAMKGTSGRADRRSPISRYCITSTILTGLTGHSKLLGSQACHNVTTDELVSRERGCCRRCHPCLCCVRLGLAEDAVLPSYQLIAAVASNVHQC